MEAAAIGNQVGDGATDDGKGGVEHGEDGEDGEEGQDGEHFSLRGEGVVQNVNQKFVRQKSVWQNRTNYLVSMFSYFVIC